MQSDYHLHSRPQPSLRRTLPSRKSTTSCSPNCAIHCADSIDSAGRLRALQALRRNITRLCLRSRGFVDGILSRLASSQRASSCATIARLASSTVWCVGALCAVRRPRPTNGGSRCGSRHSARRELNNFRRRTWRNSGDSARESDECSSLCRRNDLDLRIM